MSQETIFGDTVQEQDEQTWILQHPVKDKTPKGILAEAVKLWTIKRPRKGDLLPSFWVASSGGGDSMCTAKLLSDMGLLKGIFHIQIPGGIRMTTDFIKETCEKNEWRLEIRNPYPKYIMVALMLETGAPSFFLHPMYMKQLKQLTMSRFVKEKEIREGNPVMVTGIRKFESVRRMGNFKYPIQIDDQKIKFACPIFYWKDEEKYRYKLDNQVQVTPAHDKLGHSGECPCLSFAGPNETVIWNQLDEDSAHFLKWIEYGMRNFGTDKAKQYCKIGGEGMTEAEAQTFLDNFYTKKERQSLKIAEAIHCGIECGPGTMRGLLS